MYKHIYSANDVYIKISMKHVYVYIANDGTA